MKQVLSLLKGIPMPVQTTTPDGVSVTPVTSDTHNKRPDRWLGKPLNRKSPTLENVLDACMAEHQVARQGKFPVHVSSLMKDDFCLKQYQLLEHGLDQVESVQPPMRIIYERGNSVEKLVVDALIQGYGRENVFGRWRCACGMTRREGFGVERSQLDVDANDCTLCRTHVCTHYDQLYLSDGAQMAVGRPDLMFRTSKADSLKVLEIKSLATKAYNELGARPLYDHVAQAYTYHHLLGNVFDLAKHNVRLDTKFAVVYVNSTPSMYDKNWRKVIWVNDDDRFYEPLRAMVHAKLEQLATFKETQVAHRVCTTQQQGEAKKCVCAKQCFDQLRAYEAVGNKVRFDDDEILGVV